MSYVPPALRRKQEEAFKGEEGVEKEVSPTSGIENKPSLHSLKDIQKHFWPTWIAETPVLDSTSKNDRATEGSVDLGQAKHPQLGASDVSPDKNDGSNTTAWSASSTNSDIPTSEEATDSYTDGKSAPRIVAHKTGGSSSNSERLAVQPASSDRGKQELSRSADSVSKESVQHGLREKERGARRGDSFSLESVHPHNTLNSTEEAPHTLQYVLLFHDAVSPAYC